MAPLSLYDVSIPNIIRHLKTTKALLDKADAHTSGNVAPLCEARLIADMYPLPYQIQRMSDTAKGIAVRLGGAESEAWADDEKTFPELHARLDKTIAFLEKVDKHSMDGKEDADCTFIMGGTERKFTGSSYLLGFAMPNFYFHFVTTYDILRKEGVPIGKKDFLY